ncbi:MAG: hypothetical protein IJ550_06965 [Bacteroidaceae bacterium]|nr:hypothetical protein [Bacteroidaceae bacterium]
MKKLLLTASMLVMGVVAMFAQNWAVGDEITGKIGNPSFTEADKAPWVFDHQGGNTTETGGLFELYDGAEADLYQYIELPAGMYKLECQGYYRIGTSWDVDPKTYGTEDWVDNALLYVQNGKYNIESNEFTAGRTFKTPLMPRLFDYQDSKIYDMAEAGDESSWDMTDGDYGEKGWGPTSVPGSLKWFQAGKYMPYDDGDVKYNTVTFFLTEAGYVKIGISKEKKGDADSFMATNFKLFYAGEAGEAAELMALQEEVDDLYAQLKDLRDQNPGFLQGKLGDELILFDMEYGASADMDKEDCATAKEVLFALLDEAKAAKNDLVALNAAIKAVDVLATTTDYPGKDALNKALDAAKASVSEDYEYEGEEWDTYATLATALYAARIDYLKSSPKNANGAWDFSPFIANRFFTNEENNPTWNAEENYWEYQNWPEAWGDNMEFDGNNQEQKDARTAYSGDVVLSGSDDTVPFKWYKTGSGGPGWEVYYDHRMTSCKAWAPTPTSGVSVIGQYLSGLPNGFYSLTGMAESWTNEGVDAIDTHFIIRSGEQSSRSERAEPRAWWNGNSRDSWNTLSTDMIEVTDGDLWVEASTNGFYSITGFQLFYYGETPDFNALIKPSLDKVKEAVEALAWAGDQAAANEILAKIPASIDDKATYQAATETIAQANDYIKKANDAINNWHSIENFSALEAKYDDGAVEKSIIETALDETLELGESADDVYTDAEDNTARYNAYASYLEYRESIADFLSDPKVAPIIEEQNAYLTKTFATVEKLDEFKLAIGVKYTEAKYAADGIDKATLTDPKSVTFLLINPSFDEGPEKGWTVAGTGAAANNEYSYDDTGKRTNAELWNRPEFTFSQTVSGLPAGTYELRVRACYRDGGGVDKNMVDAYNAAGGEEEWEKHNAVLFAKSSDNEWNSYVKAIESLKATENSFTQCATAWEADELDGTNYPTQIHFMNGTIEESEQSEGITYTGHNEGDYPFDVKVSLGMDEETLVETIYYYPSSMQGFYQACKKDPTAYANSVIFYLSEAGNVELGIRKDAAIGNDWVIMDDFELYYLGKEAPTAIDAVADNAAQGAAVEYYSVSGAKQNGLQQGINIVKYQNGEVKKVFVK